MVQPEEATGSPTETSTAEKTDQPETSAQKDNPATPRILAAAPKKQPKLKGYAYLFKYVVIGDCGAGKSALLQRYSKDIFLETHQYTIGVDFDIKTLELPNGDEVKLQMWDTAGQERYRTITTTYYRGAHAIIIVHDVNDLESFNNLLQWIHEAQAHCNEDAVIAVVGTKKDVEPKAGEERYGRDKMREVLREKGIPEGEEAASSSSAGVIGVFEASAKTGEGVEEVFRAITDHLVAQKLNERNPLRGKKKAGHETVRLGQGSEKPKSRCC